MRIDAVVNGSEMILERTVSDKKEIRVVKYNKRTRMFDVFLRQISESGAADIPVKSILFGKNTLRNWRKDGWVMIN